MAWFTDKNKDGAPKTEEQVKAEQDEFVGKLRMSFEEVVKPIREKVDSYETRFSTIEEKVTKPVAPVTPNEPADIDLEPDRWRAENLGPLATGLAETRAMFVERDVLEEVRAQGYGDLVPEIKKVFSNTGAATKAQPTYIDYCNNVVNLAIGAAARKGGLKYDGGRKQFFIEDGGNNGTPADAGKRRQLEDMATDGRIDLLKKSNGDIAVWAKKMGIENVDALLEN